MGFEITIKDIIDILLVAVLLHQLYKILKRSGAVNLFLGVMAFLICWILVTYVFKMELLGGILDRIVSVGAFALIVLFQEELRRLFSRIGSRDKWGLVQYLKRVFSSESNQMKDTDNYIIQIVFACRAMSKSNTGGLIVICRSSDMTTYIQSGEQINATISARLIENIFFKNSPLHDGSMIISNKTIKAAACILPISKNQNVPKRLGLRHRAAIGITEHTDAIAIVVSEETGYISYAVHGELTTHVKPEELERFLSDMLSPRKQVN